ncbi:hypothetical protein KA977_15940 [Candidatus Dependentiae bacterium]|nr:hypothetical protein [Candidatus Dependentiae bacterium]
MVNHIIEYNYCPDEKDILEFVNGKINAEIAAHLSVCDNCRMLSENFKKNTEIAAQLKQNTKMPAQTAALLSSKNISKKQQFQPNDIKPFQIWKTVNADILNQNKNKSRIVVITGIDKTGLIYEYLPISIETAFADKGDLLITREKSVLGYEFMLETWNIFIAGAVILEKHIALFDAEMIKKINDYQNSLPANSESSELSDEIKMFRRLELESIKSLKEYARSNSNINTDARFINAVSDFYTGSSNEILYAAAADTPALNLKKYPQAHKYYQLKRYSKMITELKKELGENNPCESLINGITRFYDFLQARGETAQLNETALNILREWGVTVID